MLAALQKHYLQKHYPYVKNNSNFQIQIQRLILSQLRPSTSSDLLSAGIEFLSTCSCIAPKSFVCLPYRLICSMQTHNDQPPEAVKPSFKESPQPQLPLAPEWDSRDPSDGSDVAETGTVWWQGHFVKAGGSGSGYASFSTAARVSNPGSPILLLRMWCGICVPSMVWTGISRHMKPFGKSSIPAKCCCSIWWGDCVYLDCIQAAS